MLSRNNDIKVIRFIHKSAETDIGSLPDEGVLRAYAAFFEPLSDDRDGYRLLAAIKDADPEKAMCNGKFVKLIVDCKRARQLFSSWCESGTLEGAQQLPTRKCPLDIVFLRNTQGKRAWYPRPLPKRWQPWRVSQR